jgi:hypothetical protein
MKNLYISLEEIMKEEYERATKKFGYKHNTSHEAYAVILEEVEEAQESFDSVRIELAEFWKKVRNDNDNTIGANAHNLMEQALLGACELIQVAAMAYKAKKGFPSIHVWPKSEVDLEVEKKQKAFKSNPNCGYQPSASTSAPPPNKDSNVQQPKSDIFFERGFD